MQKNLSDFEIFLLTPGPTCDIIIRHHVIGAVYRRVEQLVARRAHNPEVVGSSPIPAPIKNTVFRKKYGVFLYFFRF